MEKFSALLAICAGIHRSSVNSPHKGQWRGALMFSLIWINGWVNRAAGDLRRHRAFYDVTVMVNCNLYIVCFYVREDNDSNWYLMIARGVWTTWTPMSAVPKRPLNLITHSLATFSMLSFTRSLDSILKLTKIYAVFRLQRKGSFLCGKLWRRMIFFCHWLLDLSSTRLAYAYDISPPTLSERANEYSCLVLSRVSSGWS